MLEFNQHYLLNEKITKNDIIDAYIIMSMPRPDDPANAFIADEISSGYRTSDYVSTIGDYNLWSYENSFIKTTYQMCMSWDGLGSSYDGGNFH